MNNVAANIRVVQSMGIRQIYVITLCVVLYYMQGVLYATGSAVSQGCLLYIALYGVYALFRHWHSRYRTVLDITWLAFLVMLTITFIVSPKTVHGIGRLFISEYRTIDQFKEAVIFLLFFFIGKHLQATGKVTNKSLAIMGLLVMVTAIIRFNYNISQYTEEFGEANFTNNAAYFFVSYIPFIPLVMKEYKKLGIISIFIVAGFLIGGAKRGALLCAFVSVIFTVLFLLKNGQMKKQLIIGGIIICVPLYFFIEQRYSENDYLQKRMEQTENNNSSGRDMAYVLMWRHWVNDKDILNQIFGNGSAQSVTVWGNFAHNDWLELLIDNGIFGCLLYLSIFISVFRNIHKAEIDSSCKLTMYLCTIIWLLKSIYSMGYTAIENGLIVILLGINLQKQVEARIQRTKRRCLIKK